MKKWLARIARSKTMLFNALMAALTALEGAFSIMQPHMESNIYAYASIVLIVGNAFLRTLTTQPLSDK
jgi:hypothetical protein